MFDLFLAARVGAVALLALAAVTVPSRADAVTFAGYGDVRLVIPSGDDDTWLEGGLSKTRFGRADGNTELRIGEIVGEVRAQLGSELMAIAWGRYDEDQRTPIDLIEAYLRYRPVSTSSLRWSVKAGAFFPPISLENDEIGWTSHWTLTPSAINSWVGEELRTLGAEAMIEFRGEANTFEANVALFGWNDPAGFLIDVRGWALGDRPTGLFDKVHLPDPFIAYVGGLLPRTTPMFKEIDDRAGYYARAAWKNESFGSIEILRYDNRADPAAFDGVPAWRTEFWSAGLNTQIDSFEILAQGMAGETEVAPFPGYDRVVEFWSAYVLVGRELGDWRLAARAELFGSDATVAYLEDDEWEVENEPDYGEYGHSFTFAATWTPEEWLRLTGEILYVDSYRPFRRDDGLPADGRETQAQLGARFMF
ncbi:MAG: hypothetical protein KBA31_18270 [Alphaproteobacteria bacterium]|nr:hypothetical protein [Alphaproteobacteria bacterium]